MDNIIVGIVILAAVIFIGRKFYLSFTGQGGCGCGGVSLSFSFGDGLDECIGLCWGGPVCDDLSDCGSFFNIEYGFDGVFDQSP